MRARFHQTPEQFLVAAHAYMASDPLSSNVVAVFAQRVVTGTRPRHEGSLWATVEDEPGQVVGLAIHTPPHPLFLTLMPASAATVLAGALAEIGCDIRGVNGACDATVPFSEAWSAYTGQASAVRTSMRLYRLHELEHPEVPGSPVVAGGPGHIDLVEQWLRAFHEEALLQAPVEDWHDLAVRRVTGGEMHLWHDQGTPVALAGVSPPAAGVARVGPVYTAPSERRRGYGAAVTAAASAAALAGGAQHVVLYTDLANPTSNAIYQTIGYRPDHDAEVRVFNG